MPREADCYVERHLFSTIIRVVRTIPATLADNSRTKTTGFQSPICGHAVDPLHKHIVTIVPLNAADQIRLYLVDSKQYEACWNLSGFFLKTNLVEYLEFSGNTH
jgi:hypothetical protein